MMASVSSAARESLRVSVASRVNSQARSFAVHGLDVDLLRQPRRQRTLVERLGGGKQQRLQKSQVFRSDLAHDLRLFHDRVTFGKTGHSQSPSLGATGVTVPFAGLSRSFAVSRLRR